MNDGAYRSVRRRLLQWGMLIGLALPLSVNANVFTLYTYHDKPPYYENNHHGEASTPPPGIYKALVDYLNSKQSNWVIKLAFQPRKRLESQLNANRLPGGIIGVNPVWFKDKEKSRYLWSPPFMQDKDVVVTRKSDAFDYQHPNDLVGMRLALPRGLYFWGVTELVNANKIEVYETSSDVQDLQMVLLNRADATITSALTFQHFSRALFKANDFAVLATPHDKFERMILFPKQYETVYRTLAPIIQEAMSDPQWQVILQHYQSD